jgi:hypothetical protein
MSLQIRRGTDAQRQTVVFDLGEILYTTDTKKFYVGDGSTLGGNNILATSAGTGLSWNSTTQTLNFSGTLSGYTTDNLAQGTVNLYYTPSRAKADIATMFTATGSNTVTGTVTATTALSISFVGTLSTINSTGVLTYTSGTVPQVGMLLTGNGITAGTYIVSGTSPTFVLSQVPTAGTGISISGAISTVTVGTSNGLIALEPFTVTGTGGGNLSAGTYYIINPSAGTNQITLATSLVNAQNGVAITNLVTNGSIPTTTFTAGGPDANITFTYNPVTGTMSVNSAASGITSVIQDTAPQLGGNLTLNSKNITGTGNINITGSITASSSLSAGSTTLTTLSATSVTATTLSSASIAVPDASLGLQISSKIGNSFSVNYYNGTAASPTAVATGSGGMVMSIKGWTGSLYQFAGAIAAGWDVGATLSDQSPKSSLALVSGAGGTNNNTAIFNSAGVFNSPVLQTTVYSVAGTALPSAVTSGIGARAFVSDATATTYASAYSGGGSNKVPVYSDGTVWRIG